MSPHKIHAACLCGEDYSYLLGLYFTDGCLSEGRKLFLSLQEDEIGIIDRAVECLEVWVFMRRSSVA